MLSYLMKIIHNCVALPARYDSIYRIKIFIKNTEKDCDHHTSQT